MFYMKNRVDNPETDPLWYQINDDGTWVKIYTDGRTEAMGAIKPGSVLQSRIDDMDRVNEHRYTAEEAGFAAAPQPQAGPSQAEIDRLAEESRARGREMQSQLPTVPRSSGIMWVYIPLQSGNWMGVNLQNLEGTLIGPDGDTVIRDISDMSKLSDYYQYADYINNANMPKYTRPNKNSARYSQSDIESGTPNGRDAQTGVTGRNEVLDRDVVINDTDNFTFNDSAMSKTVDPFSITSEQTEPNRVRVKLQQYYDMMQSGKSLTDAQIAELDELRNKYQGIWTNISGELYRNGKWSKPGGASTQAPDTEPAATTTQVPPAEPAATTTQVPPAEPAATTTQVPPAADPPEDTPWYDISREGYTFYETGNDGVERQITKTQNKDKADYLNTAADPTANQWAVRVQAPVTGGGGSDADPPATGGSTTAGSGTSISTSTSETPASSAVAGNADIDAMKAQLQQAWDAMYRTVPQVTRDSGAFIGWQEWYDSVLQSHSDNPQVYIQALKDMGTLAGRVYFPNNNLAEVAGWYERKYQADAAATPSSNEVSGSAASDTVSSEASATTSSNRVRATGGKAEATGQSGGDGVKAGPKEPTDAERDEERANQEEKANDAKKPVEYYLNGKEYISLGDSTYRIRQPDGQFSNWHYDTDTGTMSKVDDNVRSDKRLKSLARTIAEQSKYNV